MRCRPSRISSEVRQRDRIQITERAAIAALWLGRQKLVRALARRDALLRALPELAEAAALAQARRQLVHEPGVLVARRTAERRALVRRGGHRQQVRLRQ